MSDNVKFNDLSEQAQQKVVNDFVPFYIQLFRNNNLEVMSTFDGESGVIADLNREIVTVSNNSPRDIVADVIKFDYDDFASLLSKLSQTYFENGNPTVDWSEWYVNATNKLDPDNTL
ncbi:hypothetical protein [Fructilactobacillus fructivorans]|uniref:Uncharacterized protein n=1 Tax=Fructilactobacillus fructivorans TaxID=1614 RepID=A0A0C1PQ58_9LACO|nr:hypothetical protein [Fructilactobacillus fructivorans]KID42031.1 hypothetical protein LfDm3_0699 [Fructilactobacillus fructivorans]KRK57146.1 hypothetical protein FC73_GL001184 [Fructilactobacillus fructivorans]KRN12142.1 hypothetical protein IV37_GL001369 [Fructilactobacillus fructivorans]KRN40390.1 hypothetical protein IV51_GL000096 [Fructilactobacillus fructivorans]KRN42733.1 hypothetical protein IV48_GL001139 [Fructilactobacillus fructivorans]